MQPPVTCPRCGSHNVRRITPSRYECLAQVVVGGVPPSVTGLPDYVPDIQPCGERFQSGPALTTPSCAFCGLDSIGTCEDCGRRLCGNHGTDRTPFLCRICLDQRERALRDTETRAAARARADERRRGGEIAAVLRDSCDPAEIADALRAGEPLVDKEQCRAAWSRLVSSLALEPTHDLVEVVGNSRWYFTAFSPSDRGRWKEVPGRRIGMWSAPGAGEVRHRRLEEESEGRLETGIDLFLDADGQAWRVDPMTMGLSIGSLGRGSRRRFVLPCDHTCEFVADGSWTSVPRAVYVYEFDPPGSVGPFGRDASATGLVRAVATVLSGLGV